MEYRIRNLQSESTDRVKWVARKDGIGNRSASYFDVFVNQKMSNLIIWTENVIRNPKGNQFF